MNIYYMKKKKEKKKTNLVVGKSLITITRFVFDEKKKIQIAH